MSKKGGTLMHISQTVTPIYKRLEFNSFPRVWGIITIPSNFIVYRGGTKSPNLRSDPRFFSDFTTANVYTTTRPGYKTYGCATKELKLMDLRTMRYLFWEYVGYNRLYFDEKQLNLINKISFALGLMSLSDQYNFIQKYKDIEHKGLQLWANNFHTINDILIKFNCSVLSSFATQSNINELALHYSSFGNRISECSIDDEVVALLKLIFGETVDGYIAPILDSVWHDFQFNPELCLFDPNKSLGICSEVPIDILDPDLIIPPINISVLLDITSDKIVKGQAGEFNYIKKGGQLKDQCPIINEEKQKEFINSIPVNFINEKETSDTWMRIKSIWEPSNNTNEIKINSSNSNSRGKVKYVENLFIKNK